jgi:hypothetical protein
LDSWMVKLRAMKNSIVMLGLTSSTQHRISQHTA